MVKPGGVIVWHKLTLRGVFGVEYSAFRRVVDTIHSRKYPMERLHTHSFPVEQAAMYFAIAVFRLAGAALPLQRQDAAPVLQCAAPVPYPVPLRQ